MRTEQRDFNWGQWIRHQRVRQGWTQQEVANKIGATPLTVSRWERGLETPRPSFQDALSALFEGRLLELEENRNFETAGRGTLPMTPIYDPAIPPLPVPETGLIGRGDLIRRLKPLLRSHSGSYALKGMYGVGKTALATELAHDYDIKKYFSDGILWAGLGQTHGLLRLLSRWGTLLGMAPAEMAKLTTTLDWQVAIRDAIGMRRMLIIIDDAWDSEEALVFKLGGLNCVHLLTTRSQEVALAFTRDRNKIFLVDELREEDSIELLKALAPEIASTLDEAKELVQMVGGLPLALTIIGRYIQIQGANDQPRRVHTSIELLHRAEERLRLTLLQPFSERPPNLSAGVSLSLHAAIEVGDQHLKTWSRYGLHALSVFPAKPNSFSEEAALRVSAIDEQNLDELVDTGLLESCGQGRYTLHQTIADYSRLHFKAGTVVKDKEAVEERMVTYFISLVEKYHTDHDMLERELHNVLAAFHLACRREVTAALMQGVNAFAPFLEAKGVYPVVEPYLQQAKQSAYTTGEVRSVAMACLHLGRIAQLGKELKQAEQYYDEGLKAARSLGDRYMVGALQANWGEVIVHGGDHIRAEPHLQEALELVHELGNEERRMSNLLRNLGEVASCRGDVAEANELFERGLRLARQMNDYEIMSALLQNLGVDAERSGDYQKAERYYREGLDCAHKSRHQQRISAMLLNMGMLEFKRKNYEKAEALYQESLEIARKIRMPVRVSSALQNLGMLERVRGSYQQAVKYLQESLDVAYQFGHSWLISETLYEWGELYLKWKKVTEATKAFEKALEKAHEIQGKELIAASEYGLARVMQMQGNIAEAETWGKKSVENFQGTGNEMVQEVEEWLGTLPQTTLPHTHIRRRQSGSLPVK